MTKISKKTLLETERIRQDHFKYHLNDLIENNTTTIRRYYYSQYRYGSSTTNEIQQFLFFNGLKNVFDFKTTLKHIDLLKCYEETTILLDTQNTSILLRNVKLEKIKEKIIEKSLAV